MGPFKSGTRALLLVQITSGKVVAWGDLNGGGDISGVKEVLDQGIDKVWSTGIAFLARLTSGKVVAWGDRKRGADISSIKGELELGIDKIWSTKFAFLAQ